MDSPELDRLFAGTSSEVEAFRRDQEEIWSVVNGAYMSSTIVLASAQACARLPQDVHRSMMWASLLDCQMDALFLIVRRRLDTGLALLRMASELARDVARISESEARLKLWLDRREDSSCSKYRKEFRFDDGSQIERYVHALYDLSSTLGVHGHLTAYASIWRQKVVHRDGMASLEISDIEMLQVLEIWLAAAFPLHAMCVDTFVRIGDQRFAEAHMRFEQMWKLFDGFFAEYRVRLARVKADVLSTIH